MNILVILFAESKAIAYSMALRGHNVQYAAVSKEYFDYSEVPDVHSNTHYLEDLGPVGTIDSVLSKLNGKLDLIVSLSPSHQSRPMVLEVMKRFPDVPVVGPVNDVFASLETERGVFKNLCRDIGVTSPKYQVYDTDSILDHVESFSYPIMVKPYSYADGTDSDERFLVSKCRSKKELETLINTLDIVASDHKNPRVLVEEFVSGFEIACGAFFNGHEFVGPWMHMLEYKKFAAGDLGPNIDEPGVECHLVDNTENDILVNEVKKFVPFLTRNRYIGFFDVNFIVSESNHKLYALEPDCRFPFPAAIAPALQSDLAHVLLELFSGKSSLSWNPPKVTLCAAAYHIGYPLYGNALKRFNGHVVDGLHNHPQAINVNLKRFSDQYKDFLSDSYSGYMFAFYGCGDTVEIAKQNLRETFDSIKYPFMYYRSDIGDRNVPLYATEFFQG